jgi:hypothetical protein
MTSIAKQLPLVRRLLVSSVMVVLTATAASAYTLVLRDGRRIDIPNQFMVSSSTLTYEVSQGIQVTLQLATIDVVATERLNGEQSGALLLRGTTLATPDTSSESIARSGPVAQRSITNRDLESYKQARIEADSAYDQRRKEQGLPSLQETRRELTEMGDRALEQLIKNRQQQEVEDLRNQVSSMRSELMRMDSLLDTQRGLQTDLNYSSPYLYPYAYSIGGFGTGFPFGVVDSGFGNFGRFGKFGFPGHGFHRRVFTTPVTGPLARPQMGFTNRGGMRGGQMMGPRGGRR